MVIMFDTYQINAPASCDAGIFFRFHWNGKAFCRNNAWSRPWGEDPSDNDDRGYSCTRTASELVEYFDSRGGFDGGRVVVFAGYCVGNGPDGEPLAIPVRHATITEEELARIAQLEDDDESAAQILVYDILSHRGRETR